MNPHGEFLKTLFAGFVANGVCYCVIRSHGTLFTGTDAPRVIERMHRLTSISLLYVSASQRQQNFDDLMRRSEFLFPSQKWVLQSFELSGMQWPRASWGLRLLRLCALFKGRLAVCAYRLGRDADMLPMTHAQGRHQSLSRTFVCMEDSASRLYFGHIGTWYMAASELREPTGKPDFSQLFMGFIANILERGGAQGTEVSRDGGPRDILFVLVGLEGAGKTTLARNLCGYATRIPQFTGVRYSHWRRKILKSVEFPLSESQNLLRKPAVAINFLNAALSAAWFAKSVVLANLAWWLRLRPLLQRGWLVLVDRYFYNYYLDPVSVKYFAPTSWLDGLRRFFPRPDAVVTLRAPADVVLRRKQELSEAEVRRQAAVLETMKFDAAYVVAADASQPPDGLARHTLSEILKAVP